MAYQSSSEYNKFSSCNCEGDTCSSDCQPIGTVAVKNSEGCLLGYLLPSDASQYYYDTIDVPEGYVKVKDSEGNYVGLLTVAEYTSYIAASVGAGTFNIIAPAEDSGANLTFSLNGSASSTTVVGDTAFWIGRNGFAGDVTITISSANNITFGSAATSITIPAIQDRTTNQFDHATGLAAGSYVATLTWVGGTTTRTQTVTFTLS